MEFTSRGDHRGGLVAIENYKDLPFQMQRVYFLTETQPGVRRGYHAHKNLDQVLISVYGSCQVLVDDGEKKEEFLLASPTQGLRITNLVWREMFNFSRDCVLLVLASERYQESDYIRDYEEFRNHVAQSSF